MSEFAQVIVISKPKIDPKALLASAESYAASNEKSHRQTASPLRLLSDAIGHPRVWWRKGYNLGYALWLTINT